MMLAKLIFIGLFIMSFVKPNDWLSFFYISVGIYELYYLLMVLIPKPSKQIVENNYLNNNEFVVLKRYYNYFQFPAHSVKVSSTFILISILFVIQLAFFIYKKYDLLSIIPLAINLILLIFMHERLNPFYYAKDAPNNTNMKKRLPLLMSLYHKIHIFGEFSLNRKIKEYPLLEIKRDIYGNIYEKIGQYSNGRKVVTLLAYDNQRRLIHVFSDLGTDYKNYRKFYYNEFDEIYPEIDVKINPNSNIYDLYEVLMNNPLKFDYKQYAYFG